MYAKTSFDGVIREVALVRFEYRRNIKGALLRRFLVRFGSNMRTQSFSGEEKKRYGKGRQKRRGTRVELPKLSCNFFAVAADINSRRQDH